MGRFLSRKSLGKKPVKKRAISIAAKMITKTAFQKKTFWEIKFRNNFNGWSQRMVRSGIVFVFRSCRQGCGLQNKSLARINFAINYKRNYKTIVRRSSSQPRDWKSSGRDFSEVRGGSGGSFLHGGLDFLEVALVWKFPDGSLSKQTSKKFASEPPKLLRSPSRSGSMQKLVLALSYLCF